MHCALGNPHIQEYNGFAKFLDALVDEFDIFLANAAGNQSEIGRNTVADLGHAYNPMVVGSLDMHADSLRTNETRLYDVGGVSWGPTADGRKKPDIFVPVKGMYLHSPNGTVSQTASIWGQTSFAAPQVSAASILLMNCGVTNQRTIKALMLNTTFRPDSLSATTWAPGWGWGMLDANHAAYHSLNGDYFENTVRASGLGGDRIYYSGSFAPYDGVNRSYDRSTVVWEKHNSWAYGDTNITGASLTNLDLYLYNGETTELVASSTSLIDNVEQVFWDSLTDTLKLGVLVVQCNSALPAGYDYEPFSIATEEGFTHYAAAKSLVGLHTDFDSMDLPVESGEYSMTFNVWLDGAAECDTIWPDIVDLDANTVVVAGPSPGCLVLAQGDTASVEYTLVSATPGKRSLRFVALAHCYQTYWSDSVVKNFSVLNEDVESTSRPDQEDDPDAVIQFGITSVAVEVNQVVIGYEGAGGGDVALEIFDIRGRRVYSGSAESSGVVAGSMEWRYRDGQGARVASGVYFARLSSTRGAVTRKIVVVR
ncbi:MAG: S8 family peptidase [Candidatus Krumholzibacteriia bacterium]